MRGRVLAAIEHTKTGTSEWFVYSDPLPDQPPGNPEATPECDAVHDCDWIVYRCNYPADFDGGVAL